MTIVMYLCEVKSCSNQAENVIRTSGGTLYLCSAHSFIDSAGSYDYLNWISSRHHEPVHLSDLVKVNDNSAQDRPQNQDHSEMNGPQLKIVKPF